MKASLKTRVGLVVASGSAVIRIALVAAGACLGGAPLTHAGVADSIRSSKPPVETDLLKRLMGCRISGVSPTWTDFSVDLDADSAVPSHEWLSNPKFGTPVKIEDGRYALLTSDGKSAIDLWHLDVKNQGITHKAHVDAGARGAGSFHACYWHRIGDELLCEFLSVHIDNYKTYVGEKSYEKYDGTSCVTTIDLKAATVNQKHASAVKLPSKERCLGNLSKHLLADKTRLKEPDAEMAKAEVARELAKDGVEFDYFRGRFCLSSTTVDSLRTMAAGLSLSAEGVAEINRMRDEKVGRLPTCPALRDLLWQLELAKAVAAEDTDCLEKLMRGWKAEGFSPERAAALSSLAGYQRVNAIAVGVKGGGGDRLADYHAFAIACPKSLAARDAAILRIHEIAFRDACEAATVAAFDDFVTSFPAAMQVPDALCHAYELEEERVTQEAMKGVDMEKCANSLYTQWRKNEREGKLLLADRSFRLLSEHPKLTETSRAVDAQDARDNLDFRKQILGLQRAQNDTLRTVAQVQQQQLAVMGEQLTAQQSVASQLGSIGGRLQYMSDEVRGIRYEQTRTRQAVEDLVP